MLNIVIGVVAVGMLALAVPSADIRLPAAPSISSERPPPTPSQIAIASNHSIWISLNGSGSLIHITDSGKASIVAVSHDSVPGKVRPLPDGRVYFNQYRVSGSGAASEPVPKLGCAMVHGSCAGVPLPGPFVGADDFAVNRFGDIAVTDTHSGVYGRRFAAAFQLFNAPRGYEPITVTSTEDDAFWFALVPRSDNVTAVSNILTRIDRNGGVLTRTVAAGESVFALAPFGKGLVYAAGTPENDTIFRSVMSESGLANGSRRIRGGIDAFAVQRDHIWFVPSNIFGKLGELLPNGSIRTVPLPELQTDTIVSLAVDGPLLRCVTIGNRLITFRFTNLERRATANSRMS